MASMVRDAAGGTLLIAGSVLLIAVAASHPTGSGILSSADVVASSHRATLVHLAGLLALPMLMFGLVAWSRQLGSTKLAVAALLVYGFAMTAQVSAVVANGLVAPRLLADIAMAEGPNVSAAFGETG